MWPKSGTAACPVQLAVSTRTQNDSTIAYLPRTPAFFQPPDEHPPAACCLPSGWLFAALGAGCVLLPTVHLALLLSSAGAGMLPGSPTYSPLMSKASFRMMFCWWVFVPKGAFLMSLMAGLPPR